MLKRPYVSVRSLNEYINSVYLKCFPKKKKNRSAAVHNMVVKFNDLQCMLCVTCMYHVLFVETNIPLRKLMKNPIIICYLQKEVCIFCQKYRCKLLNSVNKCCYICLALSTYPLIFRLKFLEYNPTILQKGCVPDRYVLFIKKKKNTKRVVCKS